MKAQCLGFIVTHAPDVTPWQEQIRGIAAYVPHAARWEVIPVPKDVDERGVLMAAGSPQAVSPPTGEMAGDTAELEGRAS